MDLGGRSRFHWRHSEVADLQGPAVTDRGMIHNQANAAPACELVSVRVAMMFVKGSKGVYVTEEL